MSFFTTEAIQHQISAKNALLLIIGLTSTSVAKETSADSLTNVANCSPNKSPSILTLFCTHKSLVCHFGTVSVHFYWFYCVCSCFTALLLISIIQLPHVLPIYDFLLVINCHLSSISHHFRDVASRSRKPLHPSMSPPIKKIPFEFRRQTHHAKS